MEKTCINQLAVHISGDSNGDKCYLKNAQSSEHTKIIYVKCLACSRCSINHSDYYYPIKFSPLGGH